MTGVATWEPYVTHDYDAGCGVYEITVVYASLDYIVFLKFCDLVFMMVVWFGLLIGDGRKLNNT